MEEVSSIMHWYAFKVFYNKVFEIEDSLNRDKIETYIPCERILVERGGVKKYVRKPIISSLLFFYSTETDRPSPPIYPSCQLAKTANSYS